MTREELKKMRRIDLIEKPFEITGLPWVYERGAYDRIPSDLVPETCTDLFKEIARETSGGIARIRTNSSKVYFKAEVFQPKYTLYHMSRVGRSGFDFHIQYPGEEKRFLQPSVPIDYGHCTFSCEVAVKRSGLYDERPEFEGQPPIYELTIVFPTYNNVNEACIFVDEGAEVLPPAAQKYTKPVLFYGSSITQGACASRPSTCYTNHIALDLDTPIINFGFGGHCMAEDFMADLICEQEMSAFVLDYDHNAPNIEYLQKTHEPFFRRVREKLPEIPILMTTKPDYGKTLDDNDVRRRIVMDTYEHALRDDDKNVYFVDGKEFFEGARDICTVDGCHPNDLGFYKMTQLIEPEIRKILEGCAD